MNGYRVAILGATGLVGREFLKVLAQRAFPLAVLKLLANPHGRLLIADEVGLGKTIEAGIILTELKARRWLDHVVVVCPSGLRHKWRQEMRKPLRARLRDSRQRGSGCVHNGRRQRTQPGGPSHHRLARAPATSRQSRAARDVGTQHRRCHR